MVQGPHGWSDFGDMWGWAHRLLKWLQISCNLYRANETKIIEAFIEKDKNGALITNKDAAFFTEHRTRSHICDQDGSRFCQDLNEDLIGFSMLV